MKATDIRRGHVIILDGQPCRVMDFTHRTPGNLRAFVQVRLRNLVTGNTFDTRLSATDFVDEAPLETKEFQVLYRDHGGVHLMDTTTYEQHTLDAEAAGDHATAKLYRDSIQPDEHWHVRLGRTVLEKYASTSDLQAQARKAVEAVLDLAVKIQNKQLKEMKVSHAPGC